MGVKLIKSENELLAGLEKVIGFGNSMHTTHRGIAIKMGLQYWSLSLQDKLDKLKNAGRIEVEEQKGKHKFTITLIDPLTTKEKKNIIPGRATEIKNKVQANNVEETAVDKIEDNVQEVKSNDDIDALFDDLSSITRNIVVRMKDIEEENRRLKFELEIATKREQKWMASAIEYRAQLYSR